MAIPSPPPAGGGGNWSHAAVRGGVLSGSLTGLLAAAPSPRRPLGPALRQGGLRAGFGSPRPVPPAAPPPIPFVRSYKNQHPTGDEFPGPDAGRDGGRSLSAQRGKFVSLQLPALPGAPPESSSGLWVQLRESRLHRQAPFRGRGVSPKRSGHFEELPEVPVPAQEKSSVLHSRAWSGGSVEAYREHQGRRGPGVGATVSIHEVTELIAAPPRNHMPEAPPRPADTKASVFTAATPHNHLPEAPLRPADTKASALTAANPRSHLPEALSRPADTKASALIAATPRNHLPEALSRPADTKELADVLPRPQERSSSLPSRTWSGPPPETGKENHTSRGPGGQVSFYEAQLELDLKASPDLSSPVQEQGSSVPSRARSALSRENPSRRGPAGNVTIQEGPSFTVASAHNHRREAGPPETQGPSFTATSAQSHQREAAPGLPETQGPSFSAASARNHLREAAPPGLPETQGASFTAASAHTHPREAVPGPQETQGPSFTAASAHNHLREAVHGPQETQVPTSAHSSRDSPRFRPPLRREGPVSSAASPHSGLPEAAVLGLPEGPAPTAALGLPETKGTAFTAAPPRSHPPETGQQLAEATERAQGPAPTAVPPQNHLHEAVLGLPETKGTAFTAAPPRSHPPETVQRLVEGPAFTAASPHYHLHEAVLGLPQTKGPAFIAAPPRNHLPEAVQRPAEAKGPAFTAAPPRHHLPEAVQRLAEAKEQLDVPPAGQEPSPSLPSRARSGFGRENPTRRGPGGTVSIHEGPAVAAAPSPTHLPESLMWLAESKEQSSSLPSRPWNALSPEARREHQARRVAGGTVSFHEVQAAMAPPSERVLDTLPRVQAQRVPEYLPELARQWPRTPRVPRGGMPDPLGRGILDLETKDGPVRRRYMSNVPPTSVTAGSLPDEVQLRSPARVRAQTEKPERKRVAAKTATLGLQFPGLDPLSPRELQQPMQQGAVGRTPKLAAQVPRPADEVAETPEAEEVEEVVAVDGQEEREKEKEDPSRALGPFAAGLVAQCGSLERAFAYFDYSKKKKITRLAFDAGCSSLRLDAQAPPGLTRKALWKMLEAADPHSKGGGVTLEAWKSCFSQHLEGTEEAELLTADLGDRRAQALEAKKETREAAKEKMLEAAKEKIQNARVRRVSLSRDHASKPLELVLEKEEEQGDSRSSAGSPPDPADSAEGLSTQAGAGPSRMARPPPLASTTPPRSAATSDFGGSAEDGEDARGRTSERRGCLDRSNATSRERAAAARNTKSSGAASVAAPTDTGFAAYVAKTQSPGGSDASQSAVGAQTRATSVPAGSAAYVANTESSGSSPSGHGAESAQSPPLAAPAGYAVHVTESPGPSHTSNGAEGTQTAATAVLVGKTTLTVSPTLGNATRGKAGAGNFVAAPPANSPRGRVLPTVRSQAGAAGDKGNASGHPAGAATSSTATAANPTRGREAVSASPAPGGGGVADSMMAAVPPAAASQADSAKAKGGKNSRYTGVLKAAAKIYAAAPKSGSSKEGASDPTSGSPTTAAAEDGHDGTDIEEAGGLVVSPSSPPGPGRGVTGSLPVAGGGGAAVKGDHVTPATTQSVHENSGPPRGLSATAGDGEATALTGAPTQEGISSAIGASPAAGYAAAASASSASGAYPSSQVPGVQAVAPPANWSAGAAGPVVDHRTNDSDPRQAPADTPARTVVTMASGGEPSSTSGEGDVPALAGARSATHRAGDTDSAVHLLGEEEAATTADVSIQPGAAHREGQAKDGHVIDATNHSPASAGGHSVELDIALVDKGGKVPGSLLAPPPKRCTPSDTDVPEADDGRHSESEDSAYDSQEEDEEDGDDAASNEADQTGSSEPEEEDTPTESSEEDEEKEVAAAEEEAAEGQPRTRLPEQLRGEHRRLSASDLAKVMEMEIMKKKKNEKGNASGNVSDEDGLAGAEDKAGGAQGRPRDQRKRQRKTSVPNLAKAVQKKGVKAVEEKPVRPTQSTPDAEIEQEIEEIDAEGLEALAYVFIKRMGSLRKAFKWFDTINNGMVSHVAWSTGLELLHIDVEKLTKVRGEALWGKLDPDRDGNINYKEWKRFFEAVDPARMAELQKQARDEKKGAKDKGRGQGRKVAASADKAKRKRKKNGAAGAGEELDGEDSEEGENSKGRGRRGNKGGTSKSGRRGRDGGGSSSENGGLGSSPETGEDEDDEGATGESGAEDLEGGGGGGHGGQRAGRHASRKRVGRGGHLAWNAAEGLDSKLAAMDEDDFRDQVRFRLSRLTLGGCTRFGPQLSPRQQGIVKEISDSMQLYSRDQNEGVVLVAHLAEFVAKVKKRLEALGPDECIEFEPELSDIQRNIVMLLAGDLQMEHRIEGEGENEHLVVFRYGEFGAKVRKKLEALQPGQGDFFPTSLTPHERRVVLHIAEELGLYTHVHTDHESRSIEVFNLAQFAADMRKRLEQVGAGEQLELSGLTMDERRVVECLAASMGLAAQSQRKQGENVLHVANLRDFRAEIKAELEALAPGQAKDFSPDLTPLQCSVVQSIAKEMRLNHGMGGARKKAHVRVWKPAEVATGHAEEAHSDEEELESEAESQVSEDNMIDQIFDAYSTGLYRSDRIFLRFPDLGHFAEEVRGVMPREHKMFLRFSDHLEQVFDDTLELQTDLGTRTGKGLNRKWFQVFIQKAMRKIGLQIVSLLFALLNASG